MTLYTVDIKTTEKSPWQNLRSEHRRPEDAWNHLAFLRKTIGGEYDYFAACVRPVATPR